MSLDNEKVKTGKLTIPLALIQLVDRVEECIHRDLKAPKRECFGYSEYIENGRKVKGKASIVRYLEDFVEFKQSLVSGESPLLMYEEGKADEQKAEIIERILEFIPPLTVGHPKGYIFKHVVADPELKKLLRKLSREGDEKTKEAAKDVLDTINEAYWQSIAQGDAYYDDKYFIVVNTEEEFNTLLHKPHAEDYTEYFKLTNVKVGFYPVTVGEVLKEKGLYEDALEYFHRHQYKWNEFGETTFNIWHDVRSRAVIFFFFDR